MSLEQKAKTELLRVVDAYRAAQEVSDVSLSKSLYGASWFLDWLRSGGDDRSISLRKYDQVVAWLAGNWPRGAKWPSGIPHPKLKLVSVAKPRGQTKDKINGKGKGKGKKVKGKSANNGS